jgi:hypothetical protein
MTKAKSSYRLQSPRRISFGGGLTTAFAGVVCLLGTLGVTATTARAGGDSAPEWMRTAAQQTLPEYPKETSAVVLYDETVITVKDNGEIDVTHRNACKLLRSDGKEKCGYAFVEFDSSTKVSSFHAWTIMPSGGQMQVKDKEAMEVGIGEGYEVFDDLRAKVIKFPEANVGSVVGYEYTQRQRPFVYEDEWDIQSTEPMRYARLSITLPQGWEFSNFWANYPEQKPVSTNGTTSVWEVRDVPAIEVEPVMPPRQAVAARMGIKYFPRDPAMRQKVAITWDDIAAWERSLTVNSRNPSPAITQKVAELTSGIIDPLAQMKALSWYMQRNIRYAAIEVGIGGFQPHNAQDIFAHQYGDCKDKATLLSTMLKQVGIDSYYVPIFAERGVTNPKFPSMHFNHVILAIKLPDSVSDNGLYALYKSPKYGRLLIFDPTNEYVPLGYLPYYEQSSYALVVGPEGGEIAQLPLAAPMSNRLLRTATLKLGPTGTLSGEVNELLSGGPAMTSREQFLNAPPGDRQKVMERFLGGSLSSFSLTGASVGNLEQYDQSLTMRYAFTADGYAQNAGDLLILRPRVMGSQDHSILNGKKRLYPVEFREATRQDDIFDITLPAGYVVDELPKPVDATCPCGTYKSEVVMNGNVLRYKRTYTITDVMVPTEHLDEVRDFFRKIDADEKASAVLRRSTP